MTLTYLQNNQNLESITKKTNIIISYSLQVPSFIIIEFRNNPFPRTIGFLL